MADVDLASLPLHDATLVSVRLDWAQRSCEIEVALADGHAALSFVAVSHCELPHAAPWGPSSSVLGGRSLAKGVFELEMQSGDVLRIIAGGSAFELRPAAG